jgi:hypothetical protein
VRVSDYDATAEVPVLCGDPRGDVLLAHGDLTLAGGEVGAGKTISIEDLGLALAFGQPFVGFPCPIPRRVMLVLADGDGEPPVMRRIARLAAGRGIQLAELDACDRFRLFVPAGFNLDHPRDFAELERELADFDPDVVALDSLSSLMGPERNAWHQGPVADFIATRLRPLQNRADGSRRSVVAGAHLTKPRPEPGGGRTKDRLAGSFYVLGGADAAIGLEQAGEEAFKVRALKRSRWGCTFRPFLAVVEGDDKHSPLQLVNRGHLGESKGERSAIEEDVLDAARCMDGPDGCIRIIDIKARLDAPRNSSRAKAIDRAIARLVGRGDLEKGDAKGTVRVVNPGPEDTLRTP